MKIAVDAMGGDNAPLQIVKGSVDACREFNEEIILVGDQDKINDVLKGIDTKDLKLSVVHASEIVTMHDSPPTALREKPDSSLAVALNLMKTGKADTLVSAGNTGVLLTGATLYAKRIKGIRRAALCPMLPCKGGKILLIDCGANVECTAEYLLQFAFMGSFYMKRMRDIENPRIGLVNNGTEDHKGTSLQVETYKLLKNAHDDGRINFIGNIEGRDVAMGSCDVAVCDGFTGNVLLKTVEGVGLFMMSEIKNMFISSASGKLAAMLLKPALSNLKKVMDYNETGGAPLLGISKPIIKAHGSSDARTFRSAVQQAIIFTKADIITEIEQNMEYMTVNKSK